MHISSASALPSTAMQATETEEFDVFATMDLPSVEQARKQQIRKDSAAAMMANNLPGRNTAGDRVDWGNESRLLNQVQLSTYPDAIGGHLSVLESFISDHLAGVVGGVHVLPFYPSSADRGFAPLTYMEVDPQFGSWDHIKSVADKGDLCVDFMVNHISAQSEQFLDFVAKGDSVRPFLTYTPGVITLGMGPGGAVAVRASLEHSICAQVTGCFANNEMLSRGALYACFANLRCDVLYVKRNRLRCMADNDRHQHQH